MMLVGTVQVVFVRGTEYADYLGVLSPCGGCGGRPAAVAMENRPVAGRPYSDCPATAAGAGRRAPGAWGGVLRTPQQS